ncbi:hypothetical protein [Desulfurispirillum indicum]|nr:hypothetical protein [Desulfurispirillum indicum]
MEVHKNRAMHKAGILHSQTRSLVFLAQGPAARHPGSLSKC